MMTLRRLLSRINLRTILALAIGIALYFVLGRFASPAIPFAGRLRLQYALLAFFSVAFGPLEGLVIGLVGQLLVGIAGAGLWWSEVAAAALAGFGVGFMANGAWLDEGGFYGRAVRRFWLAAVLAHAAGWLVVCPALDMLLYREVSGNLMLRAAAQTAANALVALVGGSLLLGLYNRLPFGPRRYDAPYDDGYENYDDEYYGDD